MCWHNFKDMILNPPTISSFIQQGVWDQSYPPFLILGNMFLQELLSFLILNKDKVPSSSLTPALGTCEGLLESNKLVAWMVESLLVLWTRYSFISCFLHSQAHSKRNQNCDPQPHSQLSALHHTCLAYQGTTLFAAVFKSWRCHPCRVISISPSSLLLATTAAIEHGTDQNF